MKEKKKRLLNKKTQHVFQEDLMTGGWENNVAGITTCLPWSYCLLQALVTGKWYY